MSVPKKSLNAALGLEERQAKSEPQHADLNQVHANDPHEERKSKFRWGRVVFHHVLCFAWLAPAITLLVLNFEEYIVGASIGCFSCRVNPFSSTAFQAQAEFNRRDHTALGGLQFASKVLEAWFLVIVSGLIYDLLVMLTAKGDDLPVGLLAKYLQVADLLSIIDYPKGVEALMHYAFIIVVALLCILVNLMGPATAILILPNLQWRDTGFHVLGLFDKMASYAPPGYTTIASGCTAPVLAAGNFSCTASLYANSLDELFAAVATSLEQVGATEILYAPFITQEQQVSFIVNTTDPYVDWIPSRQVAREVSADYVDYAQEVMGANYTILHNSLSTILVRDGPAMGLGGGCYRGSLSVATIAADKQIRCYGGWNLFTDEEHVKCIRVGDAWNGNNYHSQFHLGDDNESAVANATVDVYFVDQAYVYGQSDSPCFGKNGNPLSSPNCDWDSMFSRDQPAQDLRNTSTNFILVEYHVPGFSTPERTTWCDDISYLGFQSYSLDPSPYSNFIHLTEAATADPQIKPGTLPLVVSPDWILAAWSVDKNGTVDGTRIAARQMIGILKRALTDGNDVLDLSTLNFLDGVVTDQALSLIDYNINNTVGKDPKPDGKDHPILKRGARIYVWAFGLSSRTSILGAVVVLIGAICALLRLLVGLEGVLGPRKYTTSKSLLELFLAALDHVPQHVAAVSGVVEGPATREEVKRPPMKRRMSVKVAHDGISFMHR